MRFPPLQVDFLPFDPTIKRTEGTLRGPDGKTFKCTKGAPHIILKLVEVDQEEVAKRVNWKVRACTCLLCMDCYLCNTLRSTYTGTHTDTHCVMVSCRTYLCCSSLLTCLLPRAFPSLDRYLP
jgi:magnesium-transporting ATPase (P-type)